MVLGKPEVVELRKPDVIEEITISIVEGLERGEVEAHYVTPGDPAARFPVEDELIGVGFHPFCEVAYIARGKGVVAIEGKKFEARPGDLFIVKPYELHGIKPDNDDPFDIAWFGIYPKEMAGWVSMYLWREGKSEKPKIHLSRAYEFWDMLSHVLEEIAFHGFKHEIVLRAELLQLFVAFARQVRFVTGEEEPPDFGKVLLRRDRKRWRQAVEAAVEFVRGNYWKRIDLETIARLVRMSPNYFCEVFKAETGLTFMEYLTRIRMAKAKELLRGTELTISEISERVGYESIHYFSRLFKEREGMSPKEYREVVR